jgi:hypothetical protein
VSSLTLRQLDNRATGPGSGDGKVDLPELEGHLSALGLRPGQKLTTEQKTHLSALLDEHKTSRDVKLTGPALEYLRQVVRQQELFDASKTNWVKAALEIPGLADTPAELAAIEGGSVAGAGFELRGLPHDRAVLSQTSQFIANSPELRALLTPPGPAPLGADATDNQWRVWGAAVKSAISRMPPAQQALSLAQLARGLGREEALGAISKEPAVQSFMKSVGNTELLGIPSSKYWDEQLSGSELERLRGVLLGEATKAGMTLESYVDRVVLRAPNLPPNGRLQCLRAAMGDGDREALVRKLDASRDGLVALVRAAAQKQLDNLAPGLTLPQLGTIATGIGQETLGYASSSPRGKHDSDPAYNNGVALFDIDYRALVYGARFTSGESRAVEQTRRFEITAQHMEGGFNVIGAEKRFSDGGWLRVTVGGQTLEVPLRPDELRTASAADKKSPSSAPIVAAKDGVTVTANPRTGELTIDVPPSLIGEEVKLAMSSRGRRDGDVIDEVAVDYMIRGVERTPDRVKVELRVQDGYATNTVWTDAPLSLSPDEQLQMRRIARDIAAYREKYGELPRFDVSLYGEGEAYIGAGGRLVVGQNAATPNDNDERARFASLEVRWDDGAVTMNIHAYASQLGGTAHNNELTAGRAFAIALKAQLEQLGLSPADVRQVMQSVKAQVGPGGPKSYGLAQFEAQAGKVIR